MTEEALNARDDRLHIPELARRARLRRVLFGVALLAAAGAAFAYYTRPVAQAELYRVEPAANRDLVQLVETTGSLDVRSRVDVPAPGPGSLSAILVEPRQHVQKGALLATLDPRAAELGLRAARASAEAAQGRFAQAKVALDAAIEQLQRTQRLLDKGLASQNDLSQAKAERERASAAVDAVQGERKLANEQVASAELGKDLGQIRAPIDGVVLRVPDRTGAAVGPEQGPLFVIGEALELMRIDAFVSETEIAQVKPGHEAEVIVQALPNQSWKARVVRIGIEPKREGGVVQYPVTLEVDNPNAVLLPGMTARVRMEIARVNGALSVHEAALRFSPEDAAPAPARSRLFVRDFGGGNELRAVRVRAGVSDGVYTQVTPEPGARLAAGDDVVIGLLRPDQRAKKPNVSLGGK